MNATLKVICRDGLRGVTHRSVATEANVHLSLTTYYFTDIEQMMLEAFQLFCDQDKPELESVLSSARDYLNGFSSQELRRRDTRKQVCKAMAELTGKHVYHQIVAHPESLALEQILFNESRLYGGLRQLSQRQRLKQIEPLTNLCRIFSKNHPEISAELLFGSITSIEYHALKTPRDELDQAHITALLRRLMGWVVGLQSE
ncbi:MAG: hypothetical protein AAGF57_19210 [Pseudomonadota bacterium]